MKTINLLFGALMAWVLISSTGCGRADGDFQGREYMPDMAHSIAYEANHYLYYSNNTWGEEGEYRKMLDPRLPVDGTVANNEYPYHYEDTDADRLRAEAELENPLKPANDEELADYLSKGKNLYTIYCSACHGEDLDGNGQLWDSGNGPYPAAPKSYMIDEMINAGDGRYYHAIMYGKNKMLSHADKVSHDERWMIIHYIRSKQIEGYDFIKASSPRMGGAAPAPVSDSTAVVDAGDNTPE